MARESEPPDSSEVEMPNPTMAPLVLSVGITLIAAGLATQEPLYVVGAVLLILGLCLWVTQLLPGQGHFHEERVPPDQRAQPIVGKTGLVDQLQPGLPGYRFRLPEKIHPISAGVLGGLAGGLVMPFPAFLYGLISGYGIWLPINLLSGLLVPDMDTTRLQDFNLMALLIGIVIHAVMSVTIGLLYGVLLPTLPPTPGGQFVWGGIIMPLLWTSASYGLMGVANPAMEKYVDWRFYFLSQVVFGMVASYVVIRSEQVRVEPAGPGPSAPTVQAREDRP